jgi:hypothetical protein
MTAKARVADLVIAYAALVDATNACDALDEVVVAADSWASATDLIRACDYLKVPRRAMNNRIPADAVEAALSDPGTVLRRRFGADTPWAPAAKRGKETPSSGASGPRVDHRPRARPEAGGL